jgi:hypothetical protein
MPRNFVSLREGSAPGVRRLLVPLAVVKADGGEPSLRARRAVQPVAESETTVPKRLRWKISGSPA